MCETTDKKSAGTFKEKASAAFKAKKWDEAIENYNKSIKIGGQSHVNLANRAACYLQTGEYEKALEDASECIKLKRDYPKGYSRKGAAYLALEKFNRAIAVYKEGLKVCKDEPSLQKGLASVKKAKLEKSKASKAIQKTQATIKASNQRANKSNRAKSITSFNMEMNRELKIKMAALQAQLDLINELKDTDKEAKLDLLFGLIDQDGNGTVSIKELASALRKRDGLGFKDSLDKAIQVVSEYDTDGDDQLDSDEFANFIDHVVAELDVGFDEFAEFLVLQILLRSPADLVGENHSHSTSDSQEGKAEDLFDLLTDKRMVELFKLFDNDGSLSLSFPEVAKDLYQITRDMDNKVRKTLGVLLMIEEDDKRMLSYEEFGRLIMAIVATADSTFGEVSEDLMIALSQNGTASKETLADLFVGVEAYQAAKDMEWEAQYEEDAVDALTYARLQKLFDLWDFDQSGDVTLSELSVGLKKFQGAAGIKDDAYQRAVCLLGFDTNGDKALGRHEFAHAMVHYSKAFNVDLHELIDFMVVTTGLKQKNAMNFQRAYGKALVSKTARSVQPAKLEFFDDDDDWGAGDEDFFYM